MSVSNVDVARRWMSAMEVGDIETLMELLADKGACWFQDSLPFAGWHPKERYRSLVATLFETEDSFFPDGIRLVIDEVIDAGEHVIFEAHSEATTRANKDYRNRYVFIFRIRDEKILEFKEYSDTAHVHDILLQQ